MQAMIEPPPETAPAAEPGADDAALVRETLATGRPDAFAGLVRRYERLVAALVARAPGARRETDDLVQDVFLEAYRRLATLADPRRFKGWIAEVALSRARTFGRRRRVEAAALPRLARPGAAPADARVEREDERRALLAALRELPEEMQAVITLRYLEGRPAAEIADALGTTPEAVRMRLSRALARLRERWKEREA
jgi:RNA polymerase sigma-70 factor (ECF subfamily)